MSYSRQIRAASKAAALVALAAAVDEIVASQPIHATDKDAIVASATAAVNTLRDDEARDVVLNISGSLGWEGATPAGEAPQFTSMNVSASAYLAPREQVS